MHLDDSAQYDLRDSCVLSKEIVNMFFVDQVSGLVLLLVSTIPLKFTQTP